MVKSLAVGPVSRSLFVGLCHLAARATRMPPKVSLFKGKGQTSTWSKIGAVFYYVRGPSAREPRLQVRMLLRPVACQSQLAPNT